ncbi:MAG: type II secretion system F family protein [Firmicutes bacterium]|nr:type II secretion system F family protein [[Eubacterium] siraeum]MCM1488458.1 type II secretion system F family protein [Bacillota bacterium]
MSATKLKPDYISKLCGELYDTVSSGIAINDGIFMLMNEGANDRVLERLLEETSKGCTFTAAVKKTNSFPSYFEDMIEIGETTGRLDSVLNELSVYYARQNEISENIKNAVTFPFILLVILIAIVILLLTQVLPIFNDVFKQLGVSMSAPAMSLMNLGTAIRTYSAAIIGAVVALAAIFIILYNLPSTHNKVLSLFKGRKLKKEMSSSKFASAMAMTISSGMDIDESLEMAKKLCDKEIEDKITSCQEMMREGTGFDKAVQKSKILDAVSSRRLTISFNTGKTDEAMKKIADEYTNKVNNAIDSKISRVEPVLVIIMSVLVGFVLFSVMLPMLSIISSI